MSNVLPIQPGSSGESGQSAQSVLPSAAELEARERLLEASIQVFARHGFEAASLRAIAEAGGVAFQLISYHFGSKEDLWRAAANLSYRRYVEIGRSLAFDLSGDLREQFRNHLRNLILDASKGDAWLRIATHEYLAQSLRYREVIKPQMEEVVRLLGAPYLHQLNRLGVVSRFSEQEAYLIIDAFCVASLVWADTFAMITGEPAGTLRSVDQLVDLVYAICIRGSSRQRSSDAAGADLTVPSDETAAPIPPAESGERRWGEQYNGLPASELARLRQLETENEHLKQMIGELSLEKRMLQQVTKGRT
jgi:AcrR family transcriptional regulator